MSSPTPEIPTTPEVVPINYATPERPVRKGPPRVWPCYVSFGLVLLAFIPLSIFLAIAYIAYWTITTGKSLKDLNTEVPPLPWLLALSVMGMFCILVGVSVVPPLLAREKLRERLSLKPVRLPWGVLWVAILGATGYSVVVDALFGLLDIKSPSIIALTEAIQHANVFWGLLLVVVIGLVGPTSEEIYCRGYLQTRLVQRHGPIIGIVISSLFFGILHMDVFHSLFAFGFGIYIGLMAYRAGSIVPAIAAHMFNNTTSVLMTWLLPAPGAKVEMVVLVAGSVAAVAAVILLAWWPQRKEETEKVTLEEIIAGEASSSPHS